MLKTFLNNRSLRFNINVAKADTGRDRVQKS